MCLLKKRDSTLGTYMATRKRMRPLTPSFTLHAIQNINA